MNRLIAVFAFSTLLASAGTFTGVISCSMCGKDHRAMNMGPDADCVKACAKHDATSKYVLLAGGRIYKLSDQETPAKFAARKVTVSGTLYEKTGIIKVDRIEASK